MDPNQARYQTSPHPDSFRIIKELLQIVKGYGERKVCTLFAYGFIVLESVGGGQMGYRISYENGAERKNIHKWGNRVSRKHVGSIITILFVIAALLCLQNTEIRHIVLPGDGETTEEAIKTFIHSVQNGTELGDAITAFCQEIVHSAR